MTDVKLELSIEDAEWLREAASLGVFVSEQPVLAYLDLQIAKAKQ